MTRRVFTPEQDKEVAELYRQGYPTRKIAELYNCEKSAVSNALEREGVPRRTNRDLTDSEEAEIVKIYYAGYPPRRIAMAYGKSEGLIKGALSRQRAKKFKDFRFNFCEAEEEQIAKIYLANKSIQAIARAYNCNNGTIRRVLLRHNIEIRKEPTRIINLEKDDKVADLYNSGKSISEISKEMNLCSTTIHKSLVRTNTTRRSNRRRFFNEYAFDDLNNEHTLYWLGFIYSDGYTFRDELKFALALKDTSHLQKLAGFLNGNILVKTNSTKCWLSVHSKHMIIRLRNLGIISRRCHFERLANEIPQGMEHHFIRGYLDGDGCISSREKVIFLGQGDILLWIKSCLVKYAQASKVVMPYQRKGIMEIAFGGYNQFRRVVDYIYRDATIFLERKKEIADKTKRG